MSFMIDLSANEMHTSQAHGAIENVRAPGRDSGASETYATVSRSPVNNSGIEGALP